MGLLGPTNGDLARLEQQLDRLEGVVTALATAQGLPPEAVQDLLIGGPEVAAEVRELHRQGRSFEAIKVLRKRTGLSLLQAKKAVDRL